jgi:signal transduction histidine kinase
VPYVQLATNVAQGYEGGDIRLRIAVSDITRRKQAEDALQESRRMIEIKVRERTVKLEDINMKLESQIKAHKKVAVQIRRLSQKLIESQESERLMISSELHDILSQELIAANMQCEHLLRDRYANASAREKRIKKVSDILLRVIFSVRNLSYELRPAGLHQFGIEETFQHYCKDYSEMNPIQVDFQAAGFEKITVNDFIAINLYRLLQESLLNIKKHADASQVTIRLVVSGKNIQFRIYDNGKGFDVQQRLAVIRTERKLGLRSIQERIDLLNGSMQIDSKPGQGTKLCLKIPIGKEHGRRKKKY